MRRVLLLSLLALPGCASHEAAATDEIAAQPLADLYGEYAVTVTGQAGGAYLPDGLLFSVPPTGVVTFHLPAVLTLGPPAPGVMRIPPGADVPGLAEGHGLAGPTAVVNPVEISISTGQATRPGDFVLQTHLDAGLFAAPSELEYAGCQPEEGAFTCPPLFLPADTGGIADSLAYAAVQATLDPAGAVGLRARLLDTHLAERRDVNRFEILVHPRPSGGSAAYRFAFQPGTLLLLTLSKDRISGELLGVGRSVTGSVPTLTFFRAHIEGRRR